jgi:hypothetical protein
VADDRKASEAEAAAIRRRWITLGEGVAVVAVLISGLSLWNSYAERTAAEAERRQESRQSKAKARTLVLKGAVEDDGRRLTLAPLGGQALQSVTVGFPAALKLDPVELSADPVLRVGAFDDALKDARDAANLPEEGDGRLTVAITARHLSDGELATDVSLYTLAYRIEGRLLRGRAVRLRGLSYAGRTTAATARARLESAGVGG